MFETFRISLITAKHKLKKKKKSQRGTAVCQRFAGEDLMEKEISVPNFQVSW